MTLRCLLRSLARVSAFLVLSLAVPGAALGQSRTPGLPELAPEARERLAQATGDSRLAPWQRDLMLRLARTGAGSTPGSPAADPSTATSTLASDDTDGAWGQPLGPGLGGHSAIYDPVRDRMVVFGGIATRAIYPAFYSNDVWALSLAGTPAWTQLTPAGTPPSGRTDHSAIYDPVRDRMVVFGGTSGSRLDDVWALSLSGTPAWTELTPSGTPPGARTDHSAIYDPVLDRMVIFGGYSDSNLNDVWALSLTDTPAWTELTPSGTPPSARSDHSAIYDPALALMVVFGGTSDSNLDDVWVLSLADTPAWTEMTPSGPPGASPGARCGHGAIYDPVRGRMVVFGGYSDSSLNDVWALSLANPPAWTRLVPSGIPPGERSCHSAVYDPVRGRMVVFGGTSGTFYFNEVWALSLANPPAWSELTPSGTQPIARYEHSAIYDPVRDRMVVFGGSTEPYLDLNDVWVLSLADPPAWTQLFPSGTPPSARYEHSAIYDPVHDRMVVFGGDSDGGWLDDVWALSLADAPAWTQLTPAGTPPGGRAGHSAIYDPVHERMVVYGGTADIPPEVWALSLADTPAWAQLFPSGDPLIVRRDHSAIYDPVRERMVVFGGDTVIPPDVWALSLTGTLAWTQLTSWASTPPSLLLYTDHSAIYDPVRDRMVVYGGACSGIAGGCFYQDVWALSLADTPAWTQLFPAGTPPGWRADHGAIYDPARDRMVVFGGLSNDCQMGYWALNDVWALSWSSVVAVDDPGVQPLVIGLGPPAPNPTRGATTVSYTLAQAGGVQLGVYDVSGRLVHRLVDGERRAGTETVVWNGMDESGGRLGAGVYFVRLVAPGLRETRRVILLR